MFLHLVRISSSLVVATLLVACSRSATLESPTSAAAVQEAPEAPPPPPPLPPSLPSASAAPSAVAEPAPAPTPPLVMARVEASLEDWGPAAAPRHERQRSSGAIVKLVFKTPGKLEITKKTVQAILGDGGRAPAGLAFVLDASSNVDILMLAGATFEGMNIDVHGHSYEAFGSIARMAAHLGDTEGMGFKGKPGDEVKLGVVFDVPANALQALEILANTLSIRELPRSRASSEGRLFRLTQVLGSESFKATNYPGKLSQIDLETHDGVVIKIKARPEKSKDASVLLPLSTDDFRIAFELKGSPAAVPCIGFRFGHDEWVLADDGEANLHYNLSIADPELLFLIPKHAKKTKLIQIGPSDASLVTLPVPLPKASETK